MSSASLPHLSFFLGTVIEIDNLIPGISSYLELLQKELQEVEVYENPMLYVEKIDYYEKIATFLDILTNERERIKESADESIGITGADENAKKNRKVHRPANS